MSGETQQPDNESEGDGRASAPVEAVASLEADLDALRRDVAALGRPRPASRPTWLLFAAAGVALAAWILTPEDLPYTAALAS